MRAVVNQAGTYAFSEEEPDIIIRTNANLAGGTSAAGSRASTNPADEPTAAAKKDPYSSGKVAFWGEDNLFPQKVVKDIEKSTILPSVLERKTGMMYGGGLVYGVITGVEKDGTRKFEAVYNQEIENFMVASNLSRYAYEALHDINTFANGFPELILANDWSRITAISTQEACWCRFSNPLVEEQLRVFINANWDNGGDWNSPETITVPCIDPYFDAVERLRERCQEEGQHKYIYPLSVPSPDKALYQLASWNSVRRSGWLDVLAAIPEFKKSLFKNQLSVKYLVEIHSAYWEWKYGDWESFSREQKRELLEKELADFNAVMAGTNGAGKTVITTTILDKRTNMEVAAFKITAIDDKLKDGLYVEDSQEAASHVYTAVGVAPSLMGVSPGKGMGDGAGGGSEPRVMFNNFVSTSKFQLDLVCEPLNLISKYNGWNDQGRPIVWRFLNPFIMTQNNGKATSQESA